MNNNSETIKKLYNQFKLGKIFSAGSISPTYEQRVSSLIGAKYTVSEELSLINNYNAYMADNSLTEYKEEYESYQAFRQQCKEKAKEI